MHEKEAVKIGIVGWNGRGGELARDSVEATGGLMQPVACVEPSDEMYEKGCRHIGLNPERYLSVKEMLARERLDGAVIASPNAFHLDNLRDFAGSGLPLILEKPLESSFEKICEVVRVARTHDAPIVVGHCMRYAPILCEGKKMLARGDIGRICSMRFVQNCHYGNSGYHGWRGKKDASGTWLIEKATHDFDIMFWMIEDLPDYAAAIQRLHAFGGDRPDDLRCRNCPDKLTCPESIQNIHYRYKGPAEQGLATERDLCVFRSEVDSPDNDHCLVGFPGGGIGTYVQWFFSPPAYHHRVYEFHGTEGAFEIDLGTTDGHILLCPRYGADSERLEQKFDYLGRNHYNGDGQMTKHFYEVIRGEAPPHTTVEQAFAAELVCYAAMKSNEERRMVNPADLVPADLADVYVAGVYSATNIDAGHDQNTAFGG